jgi:hypothetical protein
MITKEYTYKQQGDGRDSWKVVEKDEQGKVLNVYMVYEDPNKIKTVGFTDEELTLIANRMIELNLVKK